MDDCDGGNTQLCLVQAKTHLRSGKLRRNRKKINCLENGLRPVVQWLDKLPRSWEYYGTTVTVLTPTNYRIELLFDNDYGHAPYVQDTFGFKTYLPAEGCY